HWEKREQLHKTIAQGLAISASTDTAEAYVKEDVPGEMDSHRAHIFITATAIANYLGPAHAEAYLITDEMREHRYVEWHGYFGWDELVFLLCQLWSSRLSPRDMAEKLREYKTLGLADDGTAARLAQQLVWLNESYAREMLLNYLPHMIPEPQVESDLKRYWIPQQESDSNADERENIREIKALLRETFSDLTTNRINGYVDFLLHGFPPLIDAGIVCLIHHGAIWSIFIAGKLSSTGATESDLRDITSALEHLRQHNNQQPNLGIFIWRCYLSICLTEGYDYPLLYQELLDYLELNVTGLFSVLRLSDVACLLTEMAADGRTEAAEALARQYLDTCARIYAESDEEERWRFWRGEYEPNQLQTVLNAYLCLTAPPIPRRQHILETWILPHSSLMFLAQLYAYFAVYRVDEEMRELVYTAFAALAKRVDLAPKEDKTSQNSEYPEDLGRLLNFSERLANEYDKPVPGDESEAAQITDEFVDFRENEFETLCAYLIRDRQAEVVERLISAFNDQRGAFDNLRDMIRLGADSLEGMLKAKSAIDKWPSKLDFERWPHRVLLDAAKNCHVWSDVESLYNAVRSTVGQGLLEALETAIQHIPDDALTAAVKTLVNDADAMPNPLARSILLAYVLQTASSRSLELTPSSGKIVEFLFNTLEGFKAARQYDWGVPWIDWQPAPFRDLLYERNISMLPPSIAYSITMFVLARCFNSVFPEAHERAYHQAFDALYEELNEVKRWDRDWDYDQWKGPLRELLDVVGGDALIEKVIEKFDEVNMGWKSNATAAK
ncbi:MAG: hypothetical protein K8I60_18560, partial [Anaerolineae bacterium]|nr:hypothetical protein [Anaerolineae bacterium]